MADTRRQVIADLMKQGGLSREEAAAQADKILLTQGDIITIDPAGKVVSLPPGRSIFDV